MTTEPDPRTRAVLTWLREDAHENAERVLLLALDEVDTTPQRRSAWPAWRTDRMIALARMTTVAAAAIVVAIVGFRPFAGDSGSGGAIASPLPSPVLIARGSFVHDGKAAELEATVADTRVMGRMTVREVGTDASYTVKLQCTRTTPDGLILIGGVTTETAGGGSILSPVGTWAGVVLERGTPVEATLWSQRGGPTSEAASCIDYLDGEDARERRVNVDGDWTSPIEGTIEFGP